MEEIQEKIIGAAISEFSKSGLKFTMDDIARNLGMSKKTIYTVIKDKEDLLYRMVDYCFDQIKESERRIMMDPTLTTVEKLRRVLAVLPDVYQSIDLSQLYPLKEKYPKTYKAVQKRLESGWEPTLSLIRQGCEEGVLRPVQAELIKTMFEATLEQFFQQDILVRNGMTYQEALSTVVDILIDGIKA